MAEGMTETTKRLRRIERLVCEEYGFVWIDEPEEYVADLKAAGVLRKHSFRWAVEMAFVEGLRRAEEIAERADFDAKPYAVAMAIRAEREKVEGGKA